MSESLTFGAPQCFWALTLLPLLLLLFFWNEKRRVRLLSKLVAARLFPELAASASQGKRRLRFFLLLLGLASVVTALARPQLGYTWQESKRQGRDVLLAIDTSKSMLATDLAPSRLTRAKLAAQDLIDALPGDRVGLIAFAGDAFLQAPLTIDYSAVLSAINELDTNIIPRGGTDIAAAINIAAEAFGKGESENRALIIMTDGEELSDDAVKAARAHAGDFRIFTVGLGSKEGSLIPVTDEQGGTSFVKDDAGQFVKSKLDDTRLIEIAEAAGGFYMPLQNGAATMRQLLEQGLAPMREHDIDTRTSRQPIERYQWPLSFGLGLLIWALLVGERQRRPAVAPRVAVAALLLLMPWRSFAVNPGVELYDQKNYPQSLAEFQKQLGRDPKSSALEFDAGTAAYQLGDYDKALESFAKAVTTSDPGTRAKAEYNLGNTLYQRGAQQKETEAKLREWKNSVQHYDEALKTDPQDANAQANRALVQKLIEDLQKKQQEQQNQKDEQKDDEKKKDDQQQKQQQSKNDQSKDSPQKQNSGQSKDRQDQQKDEGEGNEKKPDQQKQDQNKSGSEDKENKGQPQSSPSEKSGENKPGEEPKPDQNSSGQPKNEQAAHSPAPAPSPSPGRAPLTGDIKPQSSEPKPAGEQKGEAAEAEPVKPGEMSEAQARALIESLKGEDDRVQLNERPHSEGVLKDW